MEKCVTYLLDVNLVQERVERLSELTRMWLNERGIDALVQDFVLGDNASLIVDYSFDKNANHERVKELTEMLLDRLKIEYVIE